MRLLITIGWRLLAVKVHDGDHVHVFVSASPKVCVPELVRIFKVCFAVLLFEGFYILEGSSGAGTCGQKAML
jgi:REP element-mobilizing transposase RayT